MDFLSFQASCGPLCWAAGWVVGVGVAVVDMLVWVLWLSDLTCLTELGLETVCRICSKAPSPSSKLLVIFLQALFFFI